eukprot:5669553-Lingulodinium_polyedra.AAC.1
MGWRNAMGIAQHVHRQLLLRLGPQGQAGPPLEREFRKDRVAPDLRVQPGRREAWQVYCDDFDVPEVAASLEEARELKAELH